jgi:hypothetical protein
VDFWEAGEWKGRMWNSGCDLEKVKAYDGGSYIPRNAVEEPEAQPQDGEEPQDD